LQKNECQISLRAPFPTEVHIRCTKENLLDVPISFEGFLQKKNVYFRKTL